LAYCFGPFFKPLDHRFYVQVPSGVHHALQSCLRGPDLPNDTLTGQHGDDAEDGGDLFAGEWEEGGEAAGEGVGLFVVSAVAEWDADDLDRI